METSLANIIAEFGAFEEPLIRNYTKQILNGLNHLHD
jgi:serine/threonine protein kinase